MTLRDRWIALGRVPAVRTALFLLGCLLLALTPFVGVLPGPGGVILFGAGAALVLKYSQWAKRWYACFQRRWPKAAGWANWALRRPSPRRREELRRRAQARAAAEAARAKEVARIERGDGLATLVLVREQVDAVGFFVERRFEPDQQLVTESYWAAIGFSRLYSCPDTARAEGLRVLERA